MRVLVFDIKPVPKPRMTISDKWKKRPVVMKYWAFKDALNLIARKNKFTLPEVYDITFNIGMPKYWSASLKKDRLNKPHQSKPDLDNLVKAWQDALDEEDMDVWQITARKFWAKKDSIIIKWEE